MLRPHVVPALIVIALACFASSALAAPAAKTPKKGWPANGYENPNLVLPDRPDQPVTLKPLEPQAAAEGEVSAAFAYPTYRYQIDTPTGSWASVRNRAQQFYYGAAQDGWEFRVNQMVQTGGSSTLNNYGGYLPARNFCGFIFSMNLNPLSGSSTSPCPSNFDVPPANFTQFINCDTCNGGWAVKLKQPVTFMRNVYPWSVGNENPPTDASISRPAGYTVYWRYVSENGQWAAVSDNDPSLTLNWFFVPRAALGNICTAGATPSSQPGWGLSCSRN